MANCVYTFTVNGCFLEVTDASGKLVYNFGLRDLTWTDKGNDSINLDDCCNTANIDIDCVPAYATVDLLIADLETWRDACAPPISIGSGAGTDCGTPLFVESCKDILETCLYGRSYLVNTYDEDVAVAEQGNLTDIQYVPLNGVQATLALPNYPYDLTLAGGRSSLENDLRDLGYDAFIITFPSDDIKLIVKDSKDTFVDWTVNAITETFNTSDQKVISIPEYLVTFYSDGSIANMNLSTQVIGTGIPTGLIPLKTDSAGVADGVATMVEIMSAPCGDPNTLKTQICPTSSANVVATHIDVTGAGSTTAGVKSVTICNIGNADGSLGAGTLARGQCISITADFDHSTQTYELLGAIAYDATGTTFTITTKP